jgi:lipoate synthase
MVFSGVMDPSTLEALACREALALATDLSIQRMVVASDCKQVVSDIADGTGGRYAAIVQEIKMSISDFEKVELLFEDIRSNMEAHNLAHYVLSQEPGRHMWLLAPYNILSIPVTLNVNQ